MVTTARGDVDTKAFYGDVEVAREYEQLRFATPGGQAWDQRHKDVVLSALGGGEQLKGQRVLDVGCGTARSPAGSGHWGPR
jgi:ubiquinone/menaquinone biosynthesis C-methylase UbiE